MNNNKIITTLAMIKTYSDFGGDYIDIFVPFVVHLINIKKYKEIDIYNVADDFLSEYGLIIPHYGMKTILRRCKTRGYIFKDNYKYIPNENKILSDDFSIESSKYSREINEIINDFSEYIKNNYKDENISEDEAENLLTAFIRDHNSDIVYSSEKSSTIPDIKVEQKNYYIVCKYLDHISKNNSVKFEYFLNFSIGQALADIIICEDFNNYIYNLSKLNCYLDAGIIFFLLGTGAEKMQDVYQELINALKGCKAKIFIFRHTYEEVSLILNSCLKWIDNPLFSFEKANRTMLFFVENGFHKSDAEMFIAKLDTVLKNNNIEIIDAPSHDTDYEFQIDEVDLSKKLKEVYKERGAFGREDLINQETLDRDIRSIYSIYKLRKGALPKTLKDASCIFLTTGKSFAYAVSKFEEQSLEQFTIKACVTDEFISNIIWINSPQKYQSINRKKIIADISAGLQPPKRLLKQYLHQINLLKNEKNLSEEEYFILRGHKVSIDLLSEKTLSDCDNFSAKTVQEILLEQREEASEKYNAEVSEHAKTKNELADGVLKLERANNRIKIISKYLSWIPVSVITMILVISIFSSNSWILKIAAIVGLCLNIWGLGITSIRLKIEEIIFIKIKKIIE